MPHDDLLVGIVELDGELGGENRLRRWCCAAVCANSVCRQARLRPFGDHGHLAVDDVRGIGIIEGDAIAIPRGGQSRVKVAQSICWLGVIPVLVKVDGALLRGLRVVLEKERWWESVSCVLGMEGFAMTQSGEQRVEEGQLTR